MLVEDMSTDDEHVVRWSDGEGVHFGHFHPGNAELIARDASTGAYSHVPVEEATRRRKGDGIAAGVAEAVGADLYITQRDHLLQTRRIRKSLTVVNVPVGLALLSLYLRAQEVYRVWADPTGKWSANLDKGSFFWVGARELLPSAWRWVAACGQYGRHIQNEELPDLALSALQRVQRALQTRDAVHRALNQRQTANTGDDAIASFEMTLLLLMAAVDVTAAVTNEVLGLSSPRHHAGWQRPDWVTQVRNRSTALAGVVARGTPGRNALTVLRHLRNSIHGTALQGVTVHRTGGRPDHTKISLPPFLMSKVLESIRNLGGEEAWGAEPWPPDGILADPGILLERLFPYITALLDTIMRLTPVEQLPGVDLKPTDLQPPMPDENTPFRIFSEVQRQSIRWQLGF